MFFCVEIVSLKSFLYAAVFLKGLVGKDGNVTANKEWWDGKVMPYVLFNQLLAAASLCLCLCFLCVNQMSRLAAACWFWQEKYIQYNYSAVFFSYVTTIWTRERTNIKPQDPGEPKEPFGLVPHLPLLLLYSSAFLFLGLPPSSSLPCLPSLIILSSPLSPRTFLASSYSPPFSYLLANTLPLFCHYVDSQVSNLSPRTPTLTPNLPLLVCLFHPFCLVNSSSRSDNHTSRDTFQKRNWQNRQNFYFPWSCTPNSPFSH